MRSLNRVVPGIGLCVAFQSSRAVRALMVVIRSGLRTAAVRRLNRLAAIVLHWSLGIRTADDTLTKQHAG